MLGHPISTRGWALATQDRKERPEIIIQEYKGIPKIYIDEDFLVMHSTHSLEQICNDVNHFVTKCGILESELDFDHQMPREWEKMKSKTET